MPRVRRPSPARVAGVARRRVHRHGAALLVLLATLLACWGLNPALLPTGAGAALAATATETDPLQVRIEKLGPPVLTDEKKIRIRGTVTNTSRDTYTGINLHVLAPNGPIEDTIAMATSTAADSSIGTRIITPGTFDTIPELDPGASASFSLTIARSELGIPRADGLWWLAVHALGDGPTARDEVAEGRGRMLLPVVDRPNRGTVRGHLVVPLRHAVDLDTSGRISDPQGWHRRLSPGGELYDLLELQGTGAQVTWLVDPALLEAVEQIALGNPVPELATPTPDPTGTDEPGDEPADDTGDGQPGDPVTGTSSPRLDHPVPSDTAELDSTLSDTDLSAARAARTWLARALAVLDEGELLALPWGDPDASAAVRQQSPLLAEANARTTRTLEHFGLTGTPALTGRNGYLSPGAVTSTEGATALIARQGVTRSVWGAEGGNTRVQLGDTPVVLYDPAVVDGRTDPLASSDDLGVRQRILSEAAGLRSRSDDGDAELVVRLPDGWAPRDPAAFVEALDQPWLDWQTLGSTATGPQVRSNDLVYGPTQTRSELDSLSFVAAQRLLSTSRTLARVVGPGPTLPAARGRQALRSVSQTPGARPAAARAQATTARTELSGLLGKIQIDAPRRVILSSASGHFSATVINDLPVPVRVQLRASTDSNLQLSEHEPVRIPAGGRSTLQFRAESTELGVHSVSLNVTDTRGTALGQRVSLPVRAAQVSQVIWLIMGAGAVLLFGAIVLRLLRRWRRSRALPAVAPQDRTQDAAQHPAQNGADDVADEGADDTADDTAPPGAPEGKDPA